MKTKILFFLFFIFITKGVTQTQQWETLGPDDFKQVSFEPVFDYSFISDESDNYYVAYTLWEKYIGYVITVKKWSGSSWIPLGQEGFSSSSTGSGITLGVDQSGNPYIAYNDNNITLKKWNGNTWEIFGAPIPSTSYNRILSLDINSSGEPYVAHTATQTSSPKISKWNGNSWVYLGTEEFLTSLVYSYFSFELDSSDNPYIAYTDKDYYAHVKKWNGSNWINIGATGFIKDVFFLRLKLDTNDIPNISFIGSDSSSLILTVQKWNGNTWETSASAGLPEHEWNIVDMTLSLKSDGSPFVSYKYWGSYLNADREIIINKKWNGNSWVNIGEEKLVTTQGDRIEFFLTFDQSGNPITVYRDPTGVPIVRKFFDNSWRIIGEKAFSLSSVGPDISLALNQSDIPFIAYIDWDFGSLGHLKKWNESTWEDVGVPISDNSLVNGIGSISLAFNTLNEPFVAFIDGVSEKATVKKWNGSTWETIGTSGFSTGTPRSLKLVLNAEGIPFVAYHDDGDMNRIMVKKLNGNTWESVGNIGAIVEYYRYISLALDNSGMPVVAYPDSENGTNITVKRWNGNSWNAIGQSSLSSGAVYECSLLFDSNWTLYVAYTDDANGRRSTVKRWNGSIWETIGADGFSLGEAYSLSLKVDNANNLYIAYLDRGYGDKAIAKLWNGNTWETIGDEGFSAGTLYGISMSIDNSGNLIAGYSSTGLFAKKFSTDTGVASVKGQTVEINALVYPNPASTYFKVDLDKLYDSVTLEIYDIIGRKMLTIKNNLDNIDISKLRNGIYFIKLKSNNWEISKKLIVYK